MVWIPGMSRPHFFIASMTFFSASSPSILVGSPLGSKEGGTRTTSEALSVKKSITESPDESFGLATAGLMTGIFHLKHFDIFPFLLSATKHAKLYF